MALVDVRGFNLNPDIGNAAAQGVAQGQQFGQIDRNTQIRQLLGQIGQEKEFSPQQQQLAGQTAEFGDDPIAQPQIFNQEELIKQARQIDPLAAKQQLDQLGFTDDLKRAEASRFSFQLQNTPFDRRTDMINARAESLKEQGRDARDTLQLHDLSEDQQNQALQNIQLLELSGKERLTLQSGKKKKQVIKAGQDEQGPGFFDVSGGTAVRIPGITPEKKVPLVQIGGGEKKEREELAKIRAQDFKSISTRAEQAQEQINSLDILDSIDVETGTAEPMKQAIAQWGDALGINTSGLANIEAGQAFTAEAGKVVLRVLATQKGPQTDNDRRAIAKTITRLGNKPEANRFISNVARAQADRQLEQRDFFENYLSVNDSLKGASAAWNKKKRDVPMVSQFIKTPQGLPVFFYKFKERVQEANPDATDEQITQAWQAQETKAKKSKR